MRVCPTSCVSTPTLRTDFMHHFGIIGYGGMASYHHLRIEKPEQIRFKAAFDLSAARLEKAKKDGLIAYDNLDALLADNDIDTILVATPNDTHKEYAVAAMEAGKNVICEKPVALNAQELAQMLEVAEKHGVIFTAHQNRRMDEDYRIIKKIYDENLLGDVFRIESRVQGSRGIADTWRRRKDKGGGMLYDWGVHLIDQILCLVDSPVVSVFAEFQQITQTEVDDNVRLTMTFQNGVSALVEIGLCNYIMLPLWYMAGKTGTAQIDYWDLSGKMHLLIDNDIKFEDEIPSTLVGPSITLAPRAQDTMQIVPLPKADVDKAFFYKNFLDVLDSGAELCIKPQEIMRCMQIMDLAFLSGKEKRVITCNI